MTKCHYAINVTNVSHFIYIKDSRVIRLVYWTILSQPWSVQKKEANLGILLCGLMTCRQNSLQLCSFSKTNIRNISWKGNGLLYLVVHCSLAFLDVGWHFQSPRPVQRTWRGDQRHICACAAGSEVHQWTVQTQATQHTNPHRTDPCNFSDDCITFLPFKWSSVQR